ncbi:alpha/beta hydrolase [Neorhizobium sp. JUb45]|uniref:alpha/beta fold hydrolase n=1 Tax=unclassified Neorhizobium TaxID=2629175 RepID=UPI00104550F5|nr:alpha/beta hydrolase [Neorhizobium sp. JUb45]TCQ95502.1 pimeloyl-ACP methyl ester carboxylesterase [Neorhizobium sp. JUb45]
MKFLNSLISAVAAVAITASVALPAAAADFKAKTVVLVHGAFADGSSWNKVIPLLKKAGLKVVAVQNPLDTLENDVAFTERAIADAEGPVVLVGHSYGGAVITQAGVNPKVHSLVYVAAYAPEVGQSVLDTQKPYPDAPGRPFIKKDDAGYLKFTDEGVFNYFAADLPRDEQELIAATQGAFGVKAVSTPVTQAAWHTVPSFEVVSTDDKVIPPQLQRDQVKRLKATAVEVAASHVVMLSHPDVVAKLIIEAAK